MPQVSLRSATDAARRTRAPEAVDPAGHPAVAASPPAGRPICPFILVGSIHRPSWAVAVAASGRRGNLANTLPTKYAGYTNARLKLDTDNAFSAFRRDGGSTQLQPSPLRPYKSIL